MLLIKIMINSWRCQIFYILTMIYTITTHRKTPYHLQFSTIPTTGWWQMRDYLPRFSTKIFILATYREMIDYLQSSAMISTLSNSRKISDYLPGSTMIYTLSICWKMSNILLRSIGLGFLHSPTPGGYEVIWSFPPLLLTSPVACSTRSANTPEKELSPG